MEKDTTIKVTVRIDGEEFNLRGEDSSKNQIKEVASYLDAKVAYLRSMNPGLTKNRLMLLAALNITEELLQLRKEYTDLVNMIERENSLFES